MGLNKKLTMIWKFPGSHQPAPFEVIVLARYLWDHVSCEKSININSSNSHVPPKCYLINLNRTIKQNDGEIVKLPKELLHFLWRSFHSLNSLSLLKIWDYSELFKFLSCKLFNLGSCTFLLLLFLRESWCLKRICIKIYSKVIRDNDAVYCWVG